MSGIRCSACGRDLDEIGQDNMSCTREPLCEDCWRGNAVARQAHHGTAGNAFTAEASVDPAKLREGVARSVRDMPWPAAGALRMGA